jgi:alpha-ketoglutarate-dependent taurine dioxygenase
MSTPIMSSSGRFAFAKRRAVDLSSSELITEQPLGPEHAIPLVIQPVFDGVDLTQYLQLNRGSLREKVVRAGALLFRGFCVEPKDFSSIAEILGGPLLEYKERSSPRTHLAGNVYTSTEYPADQEIFPHNENSYQKTWPMKIFFFCETPPTSGGATPIVDTRMVYQRITPAVRDRFAKRGVLYLRNFGPGIGIPWQTAFQTEIQADVEEYCAVRGVTVEWRSHGRLTTRAVRPAVGIHPVTRETTWFNHAAFFHISTLPGGVQKALLDSFAEDELPNNTYYGDGSPIESEALEEIRSAYRSLMIPFDWRTGDILALENMLVAHGRASFAGPRRIRVAMCESSG